MDNKIRLGISVGDLNGIGMELIIKTLMDPRINHSCIPIVYGSSRTASYHRKALGVNDWSFNIINDAEAANPKRANLVNVWQDEVNIQLGQADPEVGRFAFLSLEAAVNDLKAGKIDALVTAPINKDSIQSDQFRFPGHTEYLQEAFGTSDVLMFLVSDRLRVGTVTGHIPLKEVSSALKTEKIVSKLKLMYRSLQLDFGVSRPRIAVLSLNPHAGDNGLLGSEEGSIIQPAISELQEAGMQVFGPYGADGFFGSALYSKFDGVLGMYHDQVLTPFKALAFDSGVNFTAGLPVVRTSPDHGTAYDLAGKNQAEVDSFREAVYQAIDISKQRREQLGLEENAIKPGQLKLERERG
jgi:4-hydroxythreonine-4-phosphate dehydrogenase